MKLPIDPDCEPLFNIPPRKPIDLHPKRLKRYLETQEDIDEARALNRIHRYRYNPLMDRGELIDG